jgi:hypothetical protein
MTLRAYLLQSLVLAAGALGVIILLGLAIDPFGIFGTRIVPERIFPHSQNFRSGADRVRKSLQLASRTAPVELLLVGSSRTFLGFDPASARLAPLHAYNGGLGAGGLEEAARMVQFALRYHPEIRRVIWGIDSDRFLAGATDNPEVTESPMTGMSLASGRLRELVALEPVSILFRAVAAMIIGRLRPDVQADGRDITEARDRGPAVRAATFAAELSFYCRQTRLSAPTAGMPDLDLAILAQSLAMLKAHGIDVDVIIYPLHLRLLEVQYRAGRLDHVDAFKRRIVAAMPKPQTADGSGQVRLIDFNRTNALTGEAVPAPGSGLDMSYYYEASHFKPAFGDAIVAQLMGLDGSHPGLGVSLDGSTIEAVLRDARADFIDWRAHHFDDLEAVQRAGCR